MRVDDVARRCDSPDNHTSHLKREKEVRPEPAEFVDVGAGYPEAVEARTSEDELRDDEEEAEFRLEYSAVETRKPCGYGVGRRACDEEADDCADEGTSVHIACRYFVEEEGRFDHDGCEDDAHEDGPADEGALDEAGPEDAGVEK